MFCIVEFIGPDKSIAIAHRGWLVGSEKCYWPPFWKNTTKLESALQKGTLPDTTKWELFNVHIVGNKYFENYGMARRALTTSQDKIDASEFSDDGNFLRRIRQQESDIESDVEVPPPKAKRRANNERYIIRQTEKQLPNPPTPPSHFTRGASVIKNVGTPGLVAVATLYEKNSVQEIAEKSQNFTNDLFPPTESVNTGASPPSFVNVSEANRTPVIYHQSQCSADSFHQSGPTPVYLPAQSNSGHSLMTQVPFPENSQSFQFTAPPAAFIHQATAEAGQSEILRDIQIKQALLLAKVDSVLELAQAIFVSNQKPTVPSSMYELPLTSMAAVDVLDEKLKGNLASREDLTSILSVTGGDNSNQIVHRVMAKLMTDDVMLNYSFAGKKGKRCFKDLGIFNCICDAVRKQPKGSASDNKEIGRAVEYWLKRASSRLKKTIQSEVLDEQGSGNNGDQ